MSYLSFAVVESLTQAHALTGGTDPRYSAEALDKLASDLLHDVDEARFGLESLLRPFFGEAFFMAYFIYPAGEACAYALNLFGWNFR